MIQRLMEMLASRDADTEEQGVELARMIGGDEAAVFASEWLDARRGIERTEEDIAWDDLGENPSALAKAEDALDAFKRAETAARAALEAL